MPVANSLALVWKWILLSVGCRFLICSASRIWSFCLSFWRSNIVVLSVRIFWSCVVGHECCLNAELLLISLILLVRIRISSTYLRYIGGFFMLLKILFSRRRSGKKPTGDFTICRLNQGFRFHASPIPLYHLSRLRA